MGHGRDAGRVHAARRRVVFPSAPADRLVIGPIHRFRLGQQRDRRGHPPYDSGVLHQTDRPLQRYQTGICLPRGRAHGGPYLRSRSGPGGGERSQIQHTSPPVRYCFLTDRSPYIHRRFRFFAAASHGVADNLPHRVGPGDRGFQL